jgi:anti-sigma regulatory factor (Ser/Thr protein kinase)
MRHWLRSCAVPPEEEGEILVACGEACANVVRHAYPTAPGAMELNATIVEGLLEVTVRDHGTWRRAADLGGGWGLQIMGGLMDSVDVDRTSDGTTVCMRRRVPTAGGVG